eukprot:1197446-Pyramimonas_sp.AAC.1
MFRNARYTVGSHTRAARIRALMIVLIVLNYCSKRIYKIGGIMISGEAVAARTSLLRTGTASGRIEAAAADRVVIIAGDGS